jgi:hypothetical protein
MGGARDPRPIHGAERCECVRVCAELDAPGRAAALDLADEPEPVEFVAEVRSLSRHAPVTALVCDGGRAPTAPPSKQSATASWRSGAANATTQESSYPVNRSRAESAGEPPGRAGTAPSTPAARGARRTPCGARPSASRRTAAHTAPRRSPPRRPRAAARGRPYAPRCLSRGSGRPRRRHAPASARHSCVLPVRNAPSSAVSAPASTPPRSSPRVPRTPPRCSDVLPLPLVLRRAADAERHASARSAAPASCRFAANATASTVVKPASASLRRPAAVTPAPPAPAPLKFPPN